MERAEFLVSGVALRLDACRTQVRHPVLVLVLCQHLLGLEVLVNDYDPDERVEPIPESHTCSMTTFEVQFGLRVSLTDDQHTRLLNLMEEIVKAPYNQPKNGVHWLAGGGSRPNFSAIDAALLNVPAGPDAVPNGEEPTFDDDVYQLSCMARGFVSDRERARVERERASVGTCGVCGLLLFPTPSGGICKNGHGGG